MVKSLTNDILVPADAEMTLEGYLDERGYVEPEGPYGEYMGYYGAIHMDPVFHCTAITMRARRAAPHAAARLGLRARPDRQRRSSPPCGPRRRRCASSKDRARAGGGLFARDVRAAPTRCASRSGSAAMAKRARRSRPCSAGSCGSSTSTCSTRTSTSATTARSNGRWAHAFRPTRTSSSCKA